MPKKNNSKVALPARMDLAKNAFSDLTIAVLEFPFPEEVKDFCEDMNRVLRPKKPVRFPYRQLNNGLLACSSTVTHSFEWLKTINYIPQYRALAVGKSEEISDKLPTTEQIHDLILAWADTWTKQFLNKKKGNKDEIESVCDRFIDAIENIPQDWQWEYIEPATLIEDINSNNGLGYQAIPSLLATLLHEQTITIQLKDREQEITWRKVQGGGSSKTGLHLVSKPFKANYIEANDRDDSETEREGYFAYRLDFHVHTQAGRFNNKGHLKPWVFLHLSCQRYAHEPLVNANHGRDISILMGMNTARIDNYPVDSTLVRLTIKNNNNKSWQEQLPDLLAAFKARPLIKPQKILNNPTEHGNLDNQTWNKDEYYLIHAEGYKYREEGQKSRGHGHHIDTGFSLKERANITSKVLQLLDGILIPDKPMECDIKTPSGKKMPLAMRDYEYLRTSLLPSALSKYSEEEKQIQIKDKQNVIADAIKRNSQNNPIYLFIVYQEEHTKKLVYQQLRESLLLEESDEFPEYLIIEDVLIDDESLLDRIAVTGLASVNKNFNKEIKRGHNKKRQAWQKFLQKNIIEKVKNKNNANIFAIIEIKKFPKTKGIDPRQNNIHAVIREACVLENINSQMLQTVKPTEKDETAYSKKTRGRTLNAVLDITLRQTGTLYGLPSEVYQAAKIPEKIASKLDVIAFCRIKKNNFIGRTPFQYAIAVRLSVTGTVDVLLPNHKKWIPYTKAGIEIGKLFSKARQKDRDSLEQVQMKGGDLVKFVADTLINYLENPTIALIEADVWRNEPSKDGSNNKAWFQLKNEYLLEQRDILNFTHVLGHNCQYQRDDKKLNNLLGIVRLRDGQETPQYITNRDGWDDNSETIDFTKLSGFVDKTVPELLHYFSIGRIPSTLTKEKGQHTRKARNLSKIEHEGDIYAANIAYKHQRMIEMLPFFVRNGLQTEENIQALCRVPHYLRISPAYTKGNIKQPYAMYLGINLIEDLLCILGLDC
ncbi:MAG: hypothetical protein Tsb0014_32810 [Pleurocapsa sp.]